MSSPRTTAAAPPPALAPMIGVLLRLPHEVVVARMLEAVNAGGFDLTHAELGVFLYPGPDGRRPSDLARQCGTTRQAMNYVLGELEARGYVERRSERESAARRVRLTRRGRAVIAAMRACLAGVEREWSDFLGARRFEALRATLRDLARHLGKLD